jgi:predicted CXXCH cytochrome family protein
MKSSRIHILLIIIIMFFSAITAQYSYAVKEASTAQDVSSTQDVSSAKDMSSVKDIPPIDTEASCVAASCHDGMGKKKFVHGVGVNGKHCTKCHKVVRKGEHTFTLPERAIEVCAQCHSGQYIAPPDVKGDAPEIISGSDVFEEGGESTFHVPFAEGKCTACHDAHESDNYLHLKGNYPRGFYALFSPEEYNLCYKCHEKFREVLILPRTLDATGFRNGNLNLHYQHVNKRKGRSCKACHHHHGSENPKLIRDQFMFGKIQLGVNFKKTETGGGCMPTCHVPVKYDRYEPIGTMMRTTPVPGEDATDDELRKSRKRDLQRMKEKKEKAGKKASGEMKAGKGSK